MPAARLDILSPPGSSMRGESVVARWRLLLGQGASETDCIGAPASCTREVPPWIGAPLLAGILLAVVSVSSVAGWIAGKRR